MFVIIHSLLLMQYFSLRFELKWSFEFENNTRCAENIVNRVEYTVKNSTNHHNDPPDKHIAFIITP